RERCVAVDLDHKLPGCAAADARLHFIDSIRNGNKWSNKNYQTGPCSLDQQGVTWAIADWSIALAVAALGFAQTQSWDSLIADGDRAATDGRYGGAVRAYSAALAELGGITESDP